MAENTKLTISPVLYEVDSGMCIVKAVLDVAVNVFSVPE